MSLNCGNTQTRKIEFMRHQHRIITTFFRSIYAIMYEMRRNYALLKYKYKCKYRNFMQIVYIYVMRGFFLSFFRLDSKILAELLVLSHFWFLDCFFFLSVSYLSLLFLILFTWCLFDKIVESRN